MIFSPKNKLTHVGIKSTQSILQEENYLAKTYMFGEKLCAGRSVLNHCQIVGEVARELIKRMPEWLRLYLLPAGSELIAATHDIETPPRTWGCFYELDAFGKKMTVFPTHVGVFPG